MLHHEPQGTRGFGTVVDRKRRDRQIAGFDCPGRLDRPEFAAFSQVRVDAVRPGLPALPTGVDWKRARLVRPTTPQQAHRQPVQLREVIKMRMGQQHLIHDVHAVGFLKHPKFPVLGCQFDLPAVVATRTERSDLEAFSEIARVMPVPNPSNDWQSHLPQTRRGKAVTIADDQSDDESVLSLRVGFSTRGWQQCGGPRAGCAGRRDILEALEKNGTAMNTLGNRPKKDASYQCPVCGNALPQPVPAPPFDAPCSECGAYLWCRRRMGAGPVFLQAVPGRSPEPAEVEQVLQTYERAHAGEDVTFDLSLMQLVTSSFMARLISMNRRITAAGGKLQITGLQPMVRDLFQRARLDRALDLEPEQGEND